MKRTVSALTGILALTTCLQLSGCATIGAAGAGAVAGIAYSDRGVEANLKGDVDELSDRTRSVFESKGIALTESEMEKSGTVQKLKGRKGDLDVTVTIEDKPGELARAEVIAKEGLLDWDKEYAREVLSEIAKG